MARSGTLLGAGILLIGTVFGAGMWYAQQVGYYETVEGLTEVTINGQSFSVSGYQGVDGPTSPLRLRGCFQLDNPDGAIAAGQPAPEAVTLTTPSHVSCFDAETILADIRSGAATPIMAGLDEGDGADLYMAIYPDGRGYSWRLVNDKYED